MWRTGETHVRLAGLALTRQIFARVRQPPRAGFFAEGKTVNHSLFFIAAGSINKPLTTFAPRRTAHRTPRHGLERNTLRAR